ncbi:hypothetical protein BD410DRAFT_786744 [Rickenella mellea]|uniref:Uncharacterized protein n=1 Tax=Rickenella mellea TaxID=50990 RepID=A0A4Y7Q8P3_9AGAM|nr:hypothetical protein BD410DRAFT_786744 [Rickenella mellea]
MATGPGPFKVVWLWVFVVAPSSSAVIQAPFFTETLGRPVHTMLDGFRVFCSQLDGISNKDIQVSRIDSPLPFKSEVDVQTLLAKLQACGLTIMDQSQSIHVYFPSDPCSDNITILVNPHRFSSAARPPRQPYDGG